MATTTTWTTISGLPLTLPSAGGSANFSISGTLPSGVTVTNATLSLTGRTVGTSYAGGNIFVTEAPSSYSSFWNADTTSITLGNPSVGNWGITSASTAVNFTINGVSLNLTGARLTITYETLPPTGVKYSYESLSLLALHKYLLVMCVRTDDAQRIKAGNQYTHPYLRFANDNDTAFETIDTIELDNVNRQQIIASIIYTCEASTDYWYDTRFTFMSVPTTTTGVSWETYWYGIFDLNKLGYWYADNCSDMIKKFGITEKRVCYKDNILNTVDFAIPEVTYTPGILMDNALGIYNKYWTDYISDMYSPDTRIIEIWCYIKDLDSNFRRFHIYENSRWILNKVDSWNPENGYCKATFMKVNDRNKYLMSADDFNVISYRTSDNSALTLDTTKLQNFFLDKFISNTYTENEYGTVRFRDRIIEINGLKKIASDFPFAYQPTLTWIKIPRYMVNFYISHRQGGGIFHGSRNLKTIIVDSNNARYDSRQDCNAIIETATDTLLTACSGTKIPYGVKKIFDYAADYVGLDTITIPETVTEIGLSAFEHNYELKEVVMDSPIPPILGQDAFNHVHADFKIKVPAGAVDTYRTAEGWSTYAEKIIAR